MKRFLTVIVIAVVISGCDNLQPNMAADNEARAAMYQSAYMECIKALPAGPQESRYNDWAEVVSQCKTFASNRVGYATGRYW